MRRVKLLALSLTAVLSLAACSGGEGRPTAAAGTITSSAAQSFVDSYEDDIQKSANGFDADAVKNTYVSSSASRRFLGALLEKKVAAPGRADCDPTAGGTPVDADGDTIPANTTYSFSGCSGTFGNYSGAFTLIDEDDTKALPLKGFRLNIDNFGFSFSGSDSVSIQTNGFYNVAIALPTVTSATELTYAVTAGSQSANLGIYFDTSITATDVLTPDAGGTLTFGGFFKVSGGDQDYTLAISSSALTYAKPCASFSDEAHFIKDGTITVKDGSNNTITGTFTDCAAVWKYNDTTLTR